jgi:hypothetical protein
MDTTHLTLPLPSCNCYAHLPKRVQTVIDTNPRFLTNLLHGNHPLSLLLIRVLHPEQISRNFTAPKPCVPLLAQITDRFLRTTYDCFAAGNFVGDGDEEGAEAFALPGREYEDAGKVVIVPGHLLLGEEADALLGAGLEVGVDEKEVSERLDVEKDGFVVEKEFGEERKVLTIQLVKIRSAYMVHLT